MKQIGTSHAEISIKNTMFERALKRKHSEEESSPHTSLRSKVACVDSMHGSKCFFELELQIHED